jgi:hypothetical protein
MSGIDLPDEDDWKTEFKLPNKDSLRDELGQKSFRKDIYTDLGVLIDIINERNKPISVQELVREAKKKDEYDQDIGDGELITNKDKSRINKLYRWEPSISYHIVGKYPPKEVWLENAKDVLDADEVNSENIHEIQYASEKLSNWEKEQYYDASGREFKKIVLSRLENPDELNNEDLLQKAMELAIRDLPDRINSVNNASLKASGDSNETIPERALESEGLEKGEDFEMNTDDEDILIHDDGGDRSLRVECKSKNLRERAGRAAMDDDSELVLFSSFDDSDTVSRQTFSGNSQGEALKSNTALLYAPPETVSDASKEARELSLSKGRYLRANNRFPIDMAEFNRGNDFPDVEVGHEEDYL